MSKKNTRILNKKGFLLDAETFRKWFPWAVMAGILIFVLSRLIKNVTA